MELKGGLLWLRFLPSNAEDDGSIPDMAQKIAIDFGLISLKVKAEGENG